MRSLSAVVCLLIFASSATGEPPAEKGFSAIFNGTDLSGWEGNTKLWRVEKGIIIGEHKGLRRNEFLATKKKYGDFELRLEFRMVGGKGNSGVQFRSERLPKSTAVRGYQADLGKNYWGSLYDEHRRRKVLVHAPKEKLAKVLKKGGWNTYVIRAVGPRVILKINGLTTVDYTEPDDKIARDGIIALQIHSGPPLRMEFKNIRIKTIGKP